MFFSEKHLAEELVEMIKLISGKTYKQALHLFAIKSAEISGADRVCIIILNLKKQLVIKAGFPVDAHPVNKIISPEIGEFFLKQVMECRKYALVNNPAEDVRTAYMKELARSQNITSLLFMPLYSSDEPLGVLVFDFTAGKRIARENIRRMQNLADLVIVTMTAEYEKRKKEKEWQHSERMVALGENAARTAHSIRNPLMTIGGFSKRAERLAENAVKLISEKYPDIADDSLNKIFAKLKKYHQVISSDIMRIEKILNGVLEFSNSPEINAELGDINEYISVEIAKFAPVFNRAVKVRFNFEKTLNFIKVPFDKEKLSFCIQDLVRNAVEAEAGHIMVKTMLKIKENKFTIYFSNNGRPVDPTLSNGEIFTPFVTTKVDGTGLGLANTRLIIEAHKGIIELARREPTTFKITLPFRQK